MEHMDVQTLMGMVGMMQLTISSMSPANGRIPMVMGLVIT
jgi:hypothetical protein